ncbi:sensor histidine kinase [Teredinibacter haidensis]|uniref:sensor histidine kinase n=1 Tax=Teredinibacter haidensis TaxID=2731755 RepID=UPI000948B05B|nr:ATP-binding protein [Teredinibacter haidensis]
MSHPATLNAAIATESFDEKQERLVAAFDFFNETSEQLAGSYRLLEQKVGQLTRELDQVSAEKDAEHSKKALLENRMQVLLDVLPAGVIVLDARGRIVEANPAAQALLKSPLKGRLWREAISECFAPRNDDGLEVSTKSGRRLSIATSSLDSDSGTGSSSGGQIVLLTDLTETRKLQQHVSRSEKLSAMGKMVSALAHQIRTPLSAAMLYADHLCHSELEEHKRKNFSQKLYKRLQHMEHQVRDMLLFVKSELPLNDVISIADLELGLREAAEVPLLSTHSRCQWLNTCAGLEIKCHREALISAIMNLINNGIQACDGSPELSVELTVPADMPEYLVVKVRDNGPGILADMLESSREIFVTTKAQGTGLGLAVVQSVVRAHGGSFELLSPEGEGVTAVLYLPLYKSFQPGE